jgi:hypothetical protein
MATVVRGLMRTNERYSQSTLKKPDSTVDDDGALHAGSSTEWKSQSLMISSEAQNNGWESSFSVANPTNPNDSKILNNRQSIDSLLPLLRQRHLNSSIDHQSDLNEYADNNRLTRNSLGSRFSSVVLHSLKRKDS